MSSLISAEELGLMLDDVTILDVRYELGRSDGHDLYLAGHIPGAAYVDLGTDLADPAAAPPDERGRHPLPATDRFEAAMRRCGVNDDRTVVVYDDWSARAATRAWWLLTFHGHRDVRVLDGGWTWWTRRGGPVETGETKPASGDFRADPGHLPLVDAEGAARSARDGGLVDARAQERFRGDREPVDPVAGHVPGAVNVPTEENLDDGRFRRIEELARSYSGVDLTGEIAVYCGSGVTATHDVFALHLLGRRGALYAGSWSGWVSDSGHPVATGG